MSYKPTIKDQFIGRISVNVWMFFIGKGDFFPLMAETRFFDEVNIRKNRVSLYWIVWLILQCDLKPEKAGWAAHFVKVRAIRAQQVFGK